jgi:hypothetical protein
MNRSHRLLIDRPRWDFRRQRRNALLHGANEKNFLQYRQDLNLDTNMITNHISHVYFLTSLGAMQTTQT